MAASVKARIWPTALRALAHIFVRLNLQAIGEITQENGDLL
jgi:hypothetical protein